MGRSRSGIEKRQRREVAVIAVVLVLVVCVGVWSARAAHTLHLAGVDPAVPGLYDAVDALGEDHSAALAALSDTDAIRARVLVAEIAGYGSWLLDPDDTEHELRAHAELHGMLDSAATLVEVDAGDAGRNVAAAVVAAFAASVLGVALLVRSRERSANHLIMQRLDTLVRDSPDMFVVISPDGVITHRSDSLSRILPESAGHWDDLVALADDETASRLRVHVERSEVGPALAVFEVTDREGVTGSFEVRVSDLGDDPAAGGHVLTFRDVTAKLCLKDELTSQMTTEWLIGIPNPQRMPACLDAARRSTAASGSIAALFALDLDGFEAVKDLLGNAGGEQMLRLVATRLQVRVRGVGEVLWIRSDEFVVVLPNMASEAAVRSYAKVLRGVFIEPFTVGDRVEHLGVSIGMAMADEPAEVDKLHARAEIALLAAQRCGGGGLTAYEPALEESIERTNTIRRALYSAVYDDEFDISYQPIVSTASGQVRALEALIRWNSPTVGVIGPDEFIPIAEATGEICAIGHWIIENVCRQLSAWIALGVSEDLKVSFNVSARELAEGDFLQSISSASKAWEIDPQRLVAEITETAAMDQDGVAIGRLNEIRAAGFGIAIDDFGSGYSNLGQLLRAPFDVLKIDRSLLVTLTEMREIAGGDPPDACAILSAIVSIADILGIPVVGEGVETAAQRQLLEKSGVTYIQGYLTGPPTSAANATRLLGISPNGHRVLAA
ncbi:MAG: diguanylate cyclase (GGDEF)-like protein [Verrucomicrobiales bacterium]|jgi:diguanylate cyclase (GGDEF)-like protein